MKNCLATFGLFGLLALVLVALVVLIAFAQQYQTDLQQAAQELGIPLPQMTLVVPTFIPMPSDYIERTNPLAQATSPPVPTATPQPIPTNIPDPTAYRTEVLIRARQFATVLESFMGQNEKLQADPNLLNDEGWRTETITILDLLIESAWAMSDVGPVPAEYQEVQGWLSLVGPEAQTLRDNYVQGINSGNTYYFQAAAESLTRVGVNMAQAQQAMVAAGW